ncbi:MAG: hypothetical protein IJ057_11925 [Bacteroidales bacterium]|nr:hypothetical protein [Bacteroidales bacterium]
MGQAACRDQFEQQEPRLYQNHLIVDNTSAVLHPNGYDICENDTPEFDLNTNFECSLVNLDFGEALGDSGRV